MKDFYLILGIEPNATIDELKKAYRLMSIKYHPDKNKGDKYFEERFKDITEAYETLSNHASRKNYDYEWLKYFRDKKNENTNYTDPVIERNTKSETTKETTIKNRSKGLNIKTWYSVIITFICFFLAISTFNKKKELNGYKIEVASLIKQHNNRISELTFMIEKLEAEIKQSNLQLANVNKVAKKKKKPEGIVLDGSVNLTNNVSVVNLKEIQITNIEWEYETIGPYENKRGLVGISILNKTEKKVIEVEIEYKVYSSNGAPIDSKIMKLADYDEILPNSAKKLDKYRGDGKRLISLGNLDWINKSDKLVLTVKLYN